MIQKLCLHITAFLASFLLFQIELIMAKKLLPIYGGSFFVWGACVVFYQTALLLGYAFAHFAIKETGMRGYRFAHLLMLAAPLLGFPGRDLPVFKGPGTFPLTISVFVHLATTIGPAFFALSTVSMVLQAWVVSSRGNDRPSSRVSPYSLYASSNLGSFLALATYPFFFERFWDLPTQIGFWRMGYAALILLNVGIFLTLKVKGESEEVTPSPGDPATQEKHLPGDRVTGSQGTPSVLRWLILGAAGSVLFLSVTNMITQEIAPIPLLWILPLSLYLLTFVLVFREHSFCPDWVRRGIPVVMAVATVHFFFIQGRYIPFLLDLVATLALLFLACWWCQDALYRSRPNDKNQLIYFYLMFSLGSCLGSILVSWILPLITVSLIEFFVGYALLALAMTFDVPQDRVSFRDLRFILYWMAFLFLWPLAFWSYHLLAVLFLFAFSIVMFLLGRMRPRVLLLAILALITMTSVLESFWTKRITIAEKRNYYGILKVYHQGPIRFLRHGTTIHGMQDLRPKFIDIPTGYYALSTPVGEVLGQGWFDGNAMAVVGLGAGTLSGYVKDGQTMDFYELDRDVMHFAKRYFTFLQKAHGEVYCIIGDARISLGNLPDRRYDLIMVDAFSSDAIPVHLLTTEAVELYRRHLNPGGAILFHITNRYVNLIPVLSANARATGAMFATKYNIGGKSYAFDSLWGVLTWSPESFSKFVDHQWAARSPQEAQTLRPWTDNYSSVFSILQLDRLLGQLKSFHPLTL